ncbi:hypothetical protein ACFS5M_10115 [Lacinutrix iliipiscaria]|uniref:Periplasmic heavy metal sensor n=1 Tax=Lacinutrix iliipiscaria TaxID=1230532 RepID=A0ABW5WMT1_9FLAO
MKKNTALYILLVFLVIVNGFFLFNHLGKSGHIDTKHVKDTKGSPVEFIVNELGFNEEKMAKFKDLDAAFHEKTRQNLDEARQLKDALMSHITKASIHPSDIDSITNRIGEIEKNRDVLIFQHLRNVYELCSDSQKEKFSKIVKDAMRKGGSRPEGPPRRNGPPPPRH